MDQLDQPEPVTCWYVTGKDRDLGRAHVTAPKLSGSAMPTPKSCVLRARETIKGGAYPSAVEWRLRSHSCAFVRQTSAHPQGSLQNPVKPTRPRILVLHSPNKTKASTYTAGRSSRRMPISFIHPAIIVLESKKRAPSDGALSL